MISRLVLDLSSEQQRALDPMIQRLSSVWPKLKVVIGGVADLSAGDLLVSGNDDAAAAADDGEAEAC